MQPAVQQRSPGPHKARSCHPVGSRSPATRTQRQSCVSVNEQSHFWVTYIELAQSPVELLVVKPDDVLLGTLGDSGFVVAGHGTSWESDRCGNQKIKPSYNLLRWTADDNLLSALFNIFINYYLT